MRFVSDTDSFGKDTEWLESSDSSNLFFFFPFSFFYCIGIHFTKRHKKPRNINKPMGFRLSKKSGRLHLLLGGKFGTSEACLQMRGEILVGSASPVFTTLIRLCFQLCPVAFVRLLSLVGFV